MLRISLTLIIFFWNFSGNSSLVYAQRYKQEIFKKIIKTKNISYFKDNTGKSKTRDFLLDFYQPQNDSSQLRPLVIWIHGGGFKFGNKKSRGIPLWSRQFAKRGYVCAAINYQKSKGKSLSDRNALINACASAVNDIGKVISYFKSEQTHYKIDTSKIILAGNSAGGMVALQSVYSNQTLLSHQQGIASTNSEINTFNPNQIVAVINFWGALYDSAWLKNTNVPIVSVHGDKDRVVPFKNTAQGLFGSGIIHRYANALNTPNSLKVFNGYAHELQKHFIPFWAGSPAHKRWKEAGNFAANFLFQVLF